MAFEVHTPLGLGTITATDTVRGRKSYKVAGVGFTKWFDETEVGFTKSAWAPMDHDNSVALPYDPTPQYPAIPGDTESTLQPIHGIDADERLSPADSITFEDRGDDESELEPTGPNFADSHREAGFFDEGPQMGDYPHKGQGAPGSFTGSPEAPLMGGGPDLGAPTPHQSGPMGLGHDDPESFDYAHPSMVDHDDPRYQNNPAYEGHGGDDDYDYSTEGGPGAEPMTQDAQPFYHPSDAYGDLSRPYPEDTDFHSASVHNAFAFLIPLAEGLMGAGAGAAAGGAAADAGMGAVGQGIARGVGSAGAHEMMGGEGGDPSGGGGTPGAAQGVIDATSPGEGWGELQKGAALNSWLDSQDRGTGRAAGLSDRYIELTADVDYHNDPIAQFRHDPIAYIQRVGHVHAEETSPEMEHYGSLIETNAMMRESAWREVRAKAMRLRREGRVHVKDVDHDRIYASVDGDNGTYETMIVKGGAFGGFGGGHSITNWRCSCLWGQWAFKRQMTYVGRLCSHGYASYMEMQSAHTKNQPRMKKQTRPYTKRADALQNVPQRLTPDLVINDSEDTQQFLDVTKDERHDVGPDDIVDDQDIVHFARVLTACDQNNWPYPRELVSFLERLADDETTQDWKVEDTGKAKPALEDLRDWAETTPSEDWGHMDERNDDIRDAVDTARENGVDASQLVAFRTAAPGDYVPGGPRGNSSNPNGGAAASGTAGVEQGTYDQFQNPTEESPGGSYSGAPNAADVAADNADAGPDSGGSRGGWFGGGDQAPAAGGGGLNIGNGAEGKSTPGQGGAPPAAGGGGGHNGQGSQAASGSGAAGPGIGDGADQRSGDALNGGDYTVQSGDTLSDIAQRAGLGKDNYQGLADANGISDPNKIDVGQKLNLGAPGSDNPMKDLGNAVGAPNNDPASAPGGTAPVAGGPLNTNSGGPGADPGTGPMAAPAAPVANPAQTGSNPATPSTGTGAVPSVDTSAAGGGSSSSAAVDTSAAAGGGGGSSTPGAPATDTSSANGGAGSADSGSNPGGGGAGTPDVGSAISQGVGAAGDIASQIGGALSGFLGSVASTQSDYDEWVRYAYPDAKAHDHKPFNGSGPVEPLEIGTSEEYADKARPKMDDVEDLEHHNVSEPDRPRTSGIRRAGPPPRRQVVPTVVREQKVAGHHAEAHVPDFADFDPLAPRTAASFDDPYREAAADAAAVQMASGGNDIVAEFHRTGGAAAVMSSQTGGDGGGLDFAGAANEFLQRTAGRNYSLAEQHELIREGDIGGAGNLGSLQLAGTHYVEDESKNSVGLW